MRTTRFFAVDAELGNETYSLLPKPYKETLSANTAYWKQFEGPIAEVSSAVNDTYLKANRQEDGVKAMAAWWICFSLTIVPVMASADR